MTLGTDSLGWTWEKTLRIWWAWTWRTMILSMLLGALLGFVSGVVVSFARIEVDPTLLGAALGYLGTIPMSIVVLRHVLRRSYRHFSIAVVPRTP